jgi:hypothetical protein
VASYDLIKAGAITKTVTLDNTAQIFGTETPGFTGDDENFNLWSR